MTYIVGLTGGIGSGKTVVSDYFKELGVPIIDTDVIARSVVAPGQPTLEHLVAYFGDTVLSENGSLNRAKLREIAFSSEANKAKLDSITHPAIRKETQRQLSQVTFPYCLVVIPLLTIQSPFKAILQRVLVVTADHETRLERVQTRSNLTADEVRRIMRSQLSDARRLEFADDVIDNNGSILDAQKKALKLHRLYLQLSDDFSAA